MNFFQARSPGYRSLHEGVRILFSIWASLGRSDPSTWTPEEDSLAMIYSRTRTRCRRVLEHLFRVQSHEVLESIVDCWNREHMVCLDAFVFFMVTDLF